jgi:DNA-binding transcriptional ArsR family regulator
MTDPLRFRSAADEAGFTILPNPVLLSPQLGNAEKVLYALLRHWARQKQACFPGQDTLSAALGYGERHTRRLLAALEAAGLITIQQRGERRTNLYWLEPLTDALCERLAPDRTRESAPDRTPESGPHEGHAA